MSAYISPVVITSYFQLWKRQIKTNLVLGRQLNAFLMSRLEGYCSYLLSFTRQQFVQNCVPRMLTHTLHVLSPLLCIPVKSQTELELLSASQPFVDLELCTPSYALFSGRAYIHINRPLPLFNSVPSRNSLAWRLIFSVSCESGLRDLSALVWPLFLVPKFFRRLRLLIRFWKAMGCVREVQCELWQC